MMKLIKYPSKEQWAELLKRPALNTESLFDTVRTIINKVRAEGDKAVLEYEAAFDKVTLSALTVTSEEIQKAEGLISDELKSAITLAKRNIETFHSSQRFVGKKVETMEGVTCWQKAVGIEKVGLYIPGGTAPLFSTVLMLAVPAKLRDAGKLCFVPLPIKTEIFIRLFSLPLNWQVSVRYSKREECKLSLLWHMEPRVFLKSTKSLALEINM